MSELDKPLVVIKIGSSSIVKHDGDDTDIDVAKINGLCRSINDLREQGYNVLLVSSGAVAAGAHIIKIPRPQPDDLKGLSACAAIGQPQLMTFYSEAAKVFGFAVAQVLLTRSDFHDENALVYLQRTIGSLFEKGVVPILNENDVVTNRELNFGDNDGIASLITILLQANKFILLTDQDGLLDKDPNQYDDAILIEEITKFSPSMVDDKAALSSFGSGGAGAKVVAADLATYATPGLEAFIANSDKSSKLIDILNYKLPSTRIKVTTTGILTAYEAYEVFRTLENFKLQGKSYVPVADFINQ